MPEVSIRQVRKVYPGGMLGLEAVDLTIAEGEFFVLLGPSGSGKSTLLRLLAGLEEATTGEIFFGGSRVDPLAPHRRGVTYLGQRPVLYPHRNVRDNLLFGLPRSDPALVAEMLDLAEKLGVGDLLYRRPGELSGGELQRVALGRALLRPGAIILLDEPLASLDGPLRWDLRRILHLLQRGKRATMVYVTHDQDEALTLGDRLAILDRGQLVQVGTPVEVLARPATAFVARQLGWPPMTLLRGRLARGQAGLHLEVKASRWIVPPGWESFGGREVLVGWRSSSTPPGKETPSERELLQSFLFDAMTGRLLHAPQASG